MRLFNCYGISPTLLSETFLRNCIDHGVRCLEFTNGLRNFIGRSDVKEETILEYCFGSHLKNLVEEDVVCLTLNWIFLHRDFLHRFVE
ncbi:hypothetical protein AAVH_31257, partial [Aphelenchoides avenae]